ncbi:MAG: hypothetical protein ACFWT0_05785 [Bifidobacterium crudilactis]
MQAADTPVADTAEARSSVLTAGCMSSDNARTIAKVYTDTDFMPRLGGISRRSAEADMLSSQRSTPSISLVMSSV